MGEELIVVSKSLFLSKLFPNVQNEFGAFAVVQYGKELGIGPMTALQTMAIIKGKVCMGAQMMLSLAVKAGVRYTVLTDTNTESVVEFTREGYSPYKSTFTIEDAKKAGIYREGSGWDKFPKDMLYWRAVTRGLRRIAPDVIIGLYAKEEIEDAPPIDAKLSEEPVKNLTPEQEDVPMFEPPPKEDKKPLVNPKFLKAMESEKKRVGDKLYYECLGVYGFQHSNEIENRDKQVIVYQAMKACPDVQNAT